MIVTGNINKIRRIIKEAKRKNKLIGFVPTMGALHLGHLSLFKRAKKECGFVVGSIFVNPSQFLPGEDYKKYPRTFNKDKKLLEQGSVDLLFCPETKQMYSKRYSTYVEEDSLSKVLCGESRIGHFKGVCTIVAKLFNIISPDIAYFGQKDYQQAMVLKKMVHDLNFAVKIKVSPTVREKDGLALSSRNAYLSAGERRDALSFYGALMKARALVKKGERNSSKIKGEMKRFLSFHKSVKIEYIKIVDAATLKDVGSVKGKILIALAGYVGKTRLIDNILFQI
jgi:pantoate--beta-alanine ligase